MATVDIVEKAATPVSIQQPPPYITRQPLYIANPTLFTPAQWRLVAREPITAACIRHIIREAVSWEYDIIRDDSETPDEDEATIQNLKGVLEQADDGDGWDVWLTRMLQDSLVLPVGGNSEIAPDDITGMVGGLWHVDGATLYPTYDRSLPFVQINPFNGLERVYFRRDDMLRLVFQPRTDLARKMYQIAPIEDAFPYIDGLSRMYIYYLKQLSDTPLTGVLDLMDMSETEAISWAAEFREMMEGIDPIKIPILYGHTRPGKFISFSRTPQDLNIIEQFKRFAEGVASMFGLSIGDLRLFEHDRVLAGVEASQRVTSRSGTGFYAQAIEDLFNRGVFFTSQSGFRLKFELGMTGEDEQKARLAQMRAATISTLVGQGQPLIKVQDAQKQLEKWGVIDIKLTGIPTTPGLAGLEGFGSPVDNLASMDENAGAVQELADGSVQLDPVSDIDAVADELQGLYGKALTGRAERSSVTLDRFTKLWEDAFKEAANKVTSELLEKLIDKLYRQIGKAAPAASAQLDALLSQEDWYEVEDVLPELLSILKAAYEEGSLEAVSNLQQLGYASGFTTTATSPMTEFIVTNQRVIELIEDHGAELVQHVNQGTKFFLRQNILTGLDNNWGPGEIAEHIQNNLFGLSTAEANKLSDRRIRSIVNTELNWADSRATFDQMVAIGLMTKGWDNRPFGDVCAICVANNALGFVPLDHEYQTVFGEETTLHPPAHPETCRCYLSSNPKELQRFFESGVGYWDGSSDVPALKQELERETARIIAENKKAVKQKSDTRPGVDRESELWKKLEKEGALYGDILGIWHHPEKGYWASVGDWAEKKTSIALEKVLGSDIKIEAEYGPEGHPEGMGIDDETLQDYQQYTRVTKKPDIQEKSAVETAYGHPDQLNPTKRATFKTKHDAELWLGSFSLAPIISDSPIDAIGGQYTDVGVIWGDDSQPPIEAALLPINQLPLEEIKTGRATLFGAKGMLKSDLEIELDVPATRDGVVVILPVPQNVRDRLGGTDVVPHVTLGYFGHLSDPGFDITKVYQTLNDVCGSTSYDGLTLILTGEIENFGGTQVALVQLTPELKRLHDSLRDTARRYGQTLDATWRDYRPHISLRKVEDISDEVPELAITWQVVGLELLVGDESQWFSFMTLKSLLFESLLGDIPAHYRQEFVQFLKIKLGQEDIDAIKDEDLKVLYNDFLSTLLAGGFDYWKQERPEDIRAVTKSKNGWEYQNAPGMLAALLSGTPDFSAAARWLVAKGYDFAPKEVTSTFSEPENDKALDELLLMVKGMEDIRQRAMTSLAKMTDDLVLQKSQPPVINIHEAPITISMPPIQVNIPESKAVANMQPDINVTVNTPETPITLNAKMEAASVLEKSLANYTIEKDEFGRISRFVSEDGKDVRVVVRDEEGRPVRIISLEETT